MNLNVNISVVEIGSKFVAVTKVGGFTLRGKSATTSALAVRNLFFTMAGEDAASDDAVLGIELALSGTTIEAALLNDGKTTK
jgi:hypothetical protein